VVQFLTLDDVIESHSLQIETYGGSLGVRDLGLLESALAQPEAGFGGQFLHADIFEMASAYLYHIVLNHPFIDGNKRVGLEAALIFLEINSVNVEAHDDELVDMVLKTATGNWSKKEIAAFFRAHSQ
jgi:death-on-curing protein